MSSGALFIGIGDDGVLFCDANKVASGKYPDSYFTTYHLHRFYHDRLFRSHSSTRKFRLGQRLKRTSRSSLATSKFKRSMCSRPTRCFTPFASTPMFVYPEPWERALPLTESSCASCNLWLSRTSLHVAICSHCTAYLYSL